MVAGMGYSKNSVLRSIATAKNSQKKCYCVAQTLWYLAFLFFAEIRSPSNPPLLHDRRAYFCQDDEHPELSAAVKLKIADILSSGDETTRAAAVRDVERSALQVVFSNAPTVANVPSNIYKQRCSFRNTNIRISALGFSVGFLCGTVSEKSKLLRLQYIRIYHDT